MYNEESKRFCVKEHWNANEVLSVQRLKWSNFYVEYRICQCHIYEALCPVSDSNKLWRSRQRLQNSCNAPKWRDRPDPRKGYIPPRPLTNSGATILTLTLLLTTDLKVCRPAILKPYTFNQRTSEHETQCIHCTYGGRLPVVIASISFLQAKIFPRSPLTANYLQPV